MGMLSNQHAHLSLHFAPAALVAVEWVVSSHVSQQQQQVRLPPQELHLSARNFS